MLGANKDTEDGRSFLRSRSPLFFANKVRKPLLIVHGSNDPRVRQSESDQFVAGLKRNRIPVEYLVFPDEGHGPRKPENILAMVGVIENFLSKCLNGESEPFILGMYNSTGIVGLRIFKRPNTLFRWWKIPNQIWGVACLLGGQELKIWHD